MTPLLSIETLPLDSGLRADKATGMSRETGPITKLRCKGGYHLTVMEFSGTGRVAVPCSHKWCKRGGAKVIHIFDLANGKLLDTIYEDAIDPSEILGFENKSKPEIESGTEG